MAKEFRKLTSDIESTAVPNVSGPPTFADVIQYWPIIKLALRLAMIFTGPKADEKIKRVIAWGDAIT